MTVEEAEWTAVKRKNSLFWKCSKDFILAIKLIKKNTEQTITLLVEQLETINNKEQKVPNIPNIKPGIISLVGGGLI